MSEIFYPCVEDGNKFNKCVFCATVYGVHVLPDFICYNRGRLPPCSYFPVEPQRDGVRETCKPVVESAWHCAGRTVSAQRNWYFYGHCEETEQVLFSNKVIRTRGSSWLSSHGPQTRGSSTYPCQGARRGRAGGGVSSGGAGPEGRVRRGWTARPYQHRGPTGAWPPGSETAYKSPRVGPRDPLLPSLAHGSLVFRPSCCAHTTTSPPPRETPTSWCLKPCGSKCDLDSFTLLELQSPPLISEELK